VHADEPESCRRRRDDTNTLFVFATDESDHFVGGSPEPADCDGVHPRSYAKIGEPSVDLPRLLNDQRRNATAFLLHDDFTPAIY
jgi:hypothetical protein